MKLCSKCQTKKAFEFFAKSSKNKDGLQGWCRTCVNCARRKPTLSPDEITKQKQICKKRRLEKKKEYYRKNRETHLQRMMEHYQANLEVYKTRAIQWKIKNRDKWNARCMERYTLKLRACPKWLTEDEHWMIEQAYALAKMREQVCGGKWHVDHIVPLRGKTVSGLHVPWNLQVIPASVNCAKRNTWK